VVIAARKKKLIALFLLAYHVLCWVFRGDAIATQSDYAFPSCHRVGYGPSENRSEWYPLEPTARARGLR